MTWSYTVPAFLGVSCGCILADGTYTFCQLSYDVGQGPPSHRKSDRGTSGPFYPFYRIKEASFSLRESSRKPSGRTRKLYANALYGRVWPEENRPLAVARRGGGRLGSAGRRPPIGPAGRSVDVPDRLLDADGRPPWRTDLRPRGGLGRTRSRGIRRWTCGESRHDGRPPGTRRRCTSRERTPHGRNGSRRSPIRT